MEICSCNCTCYVVLLCKEFSYRAHCDNGMFSGASIMIIDFGVLTPTFVVCWSVQKIWLSKKAKKNLIFQKKYELQD